MLSAPGGAMAGRTERRKPRKWVRDVDWKRGLQDFLIVLIAAWSLMLFIAVLHTVA
jgi:hypothetical protein